VSAPAAALGRATHGGRRPGGGVLEVYRAERRKLLTQLSSRVLALVCALGPVVFSAALAIQSGVPSDSLFGAWVHSSGFAVALVVLSFGGYLGFPVLAGVLAGDCFAAEDRHSTWKMILTRSRSRGELFAGKCLALLAFASALLAVTAASSVLAGLLFSGWHPLVDLGGRELPAGEALGLVAVSWLVSLPPLLAFAALAVLLSVASRSGIVGVLGPVLAAALMELLALVGHGSWMHSLLLTSAFSGWHGLLADPRFDAPLLIGLGVSALWTAACLAGAWAILRRREFAGPPMTRRAGWVLPARLLAAAAVVVLALGAAGNLGPSDVTAARLEASFGTIFNRLTVLQQRELGHAIPSGAKLALRTTCRRAGSQTRRGAGDWSCAVSVVRPSPGVEPFQTTILNYDLSVRPDGCYRAQAPPSLVGQQTLTDADGHSVVNPLYTIYGCFDTTAAAGAGGGSGAHPLRPVPKPSPRQREAERKKLKAAEREAGPRVLREITEAERAAQHEAQIGEQPEGASKR
jgi:ABC-2 type transport system permease protein